MPDELLPIEIKRASRGRTSPAHPLRDCIEFLKKIHVELGASPATRETIAEALGHSGMSGTAAVKVGALTHFNLLDGRGNNYTISPLGMQIIMPTTAGEVEAAVAQAAKCPSLYADLIAEFSGKALPQMLGNLLHRKFGVAAKSSEEVAEKFRATMDFAGLLRNGILYSDLPAGASTAQAGLEAQRTNSRPSHENEMVGMLEHNAAKQARMNDGSAQQYTIPLGKSGRVASISLPLPVLVGDLRKLQSWLNFMESVLDDDQAETGDQLEDKKSRA